MENKTNKIELLFKYSREQSKNAPAKIAKTKDLIALYIEEATMQISFNCGSNEPNKNTVANFTLYDKGANIKELLYKLFVIWGKYIYIINGNLYTFKAKN